MDLQGKKVNYLHRFYCFQYYIVNNNNTMKSYLTGHSNHDLFLKGIIFCLILNELRFFFSCIHADIHKV